MPITLLGWNRSWKQIWLPCNFSANNVQTLQGAIKLVTSIVLLANLNSQNQPYKKIKLKKITNSDMSK